MYDIFYVSKNIGNDQNWINIKSKYPIAQKISNVKSFNDIKSRAFTKMFWVIWDDIDLIDSFNLFEYKATEWDNMYVHIFKNDEYYDGVCLFPKGLDISQREFNYRFFTKKKEIDIQASTPKLYDKFYINTYDEYLEATKKSTTEMFWAIWNNIDIDKNFKFDYRIPYYDFFHKNITHIFKNGEYFDGICLFSKNTVITKREFEYRFFTEKKEIDIQASTPKLYDIIFISYNETNADENYQKLISRFPNAKRVHGIKGIHQAHINAAKLSDTEMFWVVDGDAVVEDSFNFNYQVPFYEYDVVHVWRCKNPINDLIYGYGGVKLLPKKLTLNMDINTADMTTSISKKFKVVDEISNITSFNTDPFNAWKSAFRECCKLSSKNISGQVNSETQERLKIWCSVGIDRKYGNYAIQGALAGKDFGKKNKNNLIELQKINNFLWLEELWMKSNE